jgi:hypothetical protein
VRLSESVRLAWHRVPAAIRDTLVTVLTVRAATMSATFLGNLVFDVARPRGFEVPITYEKFVEIFAAWDFGWYWDIARHGYYFRTDGESSVAFFPLYPLLIRAVAAPFGGSDQATWVAAIMVSSGAYLLGLIALYRFAERVFGSPEWRGARWCARRCFPGRSSSDGCIPKGCFCCSPCSR